MSAGDPPDLAGQPALPARAAPPARLPRHHPDPADHLAAALRRAVQGRQRDPRASSGGSYVDFLTPGVVVMLAVSSAGWTGMGFIEDIKRGVMDRVLVSPVWRGALNLGSVAYAMVTIVDPDARSSSCSRWPLGADYVNGVGGVLILIARRGPARRGVRLAVERRRDARPPARDADRRGQPRPAPADLPLLGADAAEPRARLDPHGRRSSTRSTGPWRPGRSAAMQKIDWGLVGSRVGLLVALVVALRVVRDPRLRRPISARSDGRDGRA